MQMWLIKFEKFVMIASTFTNKDQQLKPASGYTNPQMPAQLLSLQPFFQIKTDT